MPRPTDKNLRPPWPKGQSGNPGGRPKHLSLTAALRDVAESAELGQLKIPPGQTVKTVFARACFLHAIKGNAQFARLILDRLDGVLAPGADVQDTAQDEQIHPRLVAALRETAANLAADAMDNPDAQPEDEFI